MEIGSFLELQFDKGKEWYTEAKYPYLEIARLNSGRAAIYHAFQCLDCKTIYIPYYQCDTVRDFLNKKGIVVRYYSIDKEFTPLLKAQDIESDAAILIVNYYGVMSERRMRELAVRYDHVIIDNSQAFFAKPIDTCMNVYSARKFVGVPDGAYVVGKNALSGWETYPQGYSSDTAVFLLQRHEYGCEGKTYESRMLNEHRIDSEDIMRMSGLTHKILDGTDYSVIQKKRRENFAYACQLFDEINCLKARQYFADDVVPMVYPLLIEDDALLQKLLKAKHFQGHWWSYLLDEVPKDSVEYWLSRYMIPITIDQRYGKAELEYIKEIIFE